MDTNLHASSVHIWRCRVSKVQGMFLLRSSYQRSPENSYGPIHHAGARARDHGWGQMQPWQSLLAAHIASWTDQKPQEESPPVLQGSSTRVKSELAQNIWSPSIWPETTVTHNRDITYNFEMWQKWFLWALELLIWILSLRSILLLSHHQSSLSIFSEDFLLKKKDFHNWSNWSSPLSSST